MGKYTEDDKTCPHCGGEITVHWAGLTNYWCEDCGSKDPDNPPMIDMTFPKEDVIQNLSAEGESKFTQS